MILQRQIDDANRLQRVDIYTNKAETLEFGDDTIDGWRTDGRGQARIRITTRGDLTKWDYTLAGSDKWRRLHERDRSHKHPASDDDYFEPAGFGDDPNILYFFRDYKGHRALWQRDLSVEGDSSEKLVYARDDVDLDTLGKIGKYRRAYAVGYVTDYPHMKMFDVGIEGVISSIEAAIPGKTIVVYDESWDRHYYLVQIRSDTDPGAYYRLDTVKHELLKITSTFPLLEGKKLAEMIPITYKATDGTEIPGYLTVPAGARKKGLPLVVMPHGGPQSRDEWDFDFLAQYMAAKGYAVLQSNYRGSNGYGNDWAGGGGYREWRQVVSDINDGVKGLVADGTVDPQRVCAVGWSFGGYAALLSAIEAKSLYKCVVSIAGVTDPLTEMQTFRDYTNYQTMRDWIGADDKDVVHNGSPLRRAEELNAPVLLFHGTRDMNVSIQNSLKLKGKLERLQKPVEYVEYKDAEHSIWRNAYRIDLLTRVGAFLDAHIGKSRVLAVEHH